MADVYKIHLLVEDYKSVLPEDGAIYSERDNVLISDGTPVRDRWTPLRTVVDNSSGKMGDIYSLGAGRIVFTDAAHHRLCKLLDGVGEWLPVNWPKGSGQYLNITSAAHCIDEERSEWERDEESGKRLWLIHPVFHYEIILKTPLFKDLGQFTHTFLLSDGDDSESEVKRCIESGELTGISLDLVWQTQQTQEWKSVW